jgi:hypothetical protein
MAPILISKDPTNQTIIFPLSYYSSTFASAIRTGTHEIVTGKSL